MFELSFKKTFAAMDDATCLIVIVGSFQDNYLIHGAPDRSENQSQPLFAEQLAASGIKTVVINFDQHFPRESLNSDPGFEARPHLWMANYALNVNRMREFPARLPQDIMAKYKGYEDLNSNQLLPLPAFILNRMNQFLNEDVHKKLIMIDHSMLSAPLCRHLYSYIDKQEQTLVVSAYWSGLPAIILDHDAAKISGTLLDPPIAGITEHFLRLYNEDLTPDEIKKCKKLPLVSDGEIINERYSYVRQHPGVREYIIGGRAENTPENWVICSSISDIMPFHLGFNLTSETVNTGYHAIEKIFYDALNIASASNETPDKKKFMDGLNALKRETLANFTTEKANFDFDNSVILANSALSLATKVGSNTVTQTDVNQFTQATQKYKTSHAFAIALAVIIGAVIGMIAGAAIGFAVGSVPSAIIGGVAGLVVGGGIAGGSSTMWYTKKEPLNKIYSAATEMVPSLTDLAPENRTLC